MANIQQNLDKIKAARYGRDVRDAIHDSISNCYEDGKAGAIDLVARNSIVNSSPAGAYANLAALISANPAHDKIYITLDDGKWNYWNGTAFVAGGVYQAADFPGYFAEENELWEVV